MSMIQQVCKALEKKASESGTHLALDGNQPAALTFGGPDPHVYNIQSRDGAEQFEAYITLHGKNASMVMDLCEKAKQALSGKLQTEEGNLYTVQAEGAENPMGRDEHGRPAKQIELNISAGYAE